MPYSKVRQERDPENREMDEALFQTYDIGQSRWEYIKEMERLGYTLIIPKRHQIQIDIDTQEQYERFSRQYQILSTVCTMVITKEGPSRSGLPHRHIYIDMPFDMTMSQRIAYQAALGSDPTRELLSLIRLAAGVENPVLLAEKNP
jgi:hypothetical protein